jgi:hypothetical protein
LGKEPSSITFLVQATELQKANSVVREYHLIFQKQSPRGSVTLAPFYKDLADAGVSYIILLDTTYFIKTNLLFPPSPAVAKKEIETAKAKAKFAKDYFSDTGRHWDER